MLELKADSAEDAQRRLSRLQYATFKGELVAKVPAPGKTSGFLAPILSFFLWLLGPTRKNK
jgi:hypothetical protein